MSWPGTDPYYNYNSSEADARRSFYAVNAVPGAFVEGTDGGWPWDPNWGNAILSHSNVDPEADISVTGYFDVGTRDGEITIGVTPLGATSGTRTLQVVLVENDLYYAPSYQTYDYHENVMRDMIPDANGTPVVLATGSTSTVEMAFVVPEEVIIENAKLVIFVQNNSSKAILNAYGIPVLSIVQDCLNETGDIIDFGAINVQDLVKLITIILGTDSGSDYCQLAAADLNEDGGINIQDVVMLIEVIIG